MLMAAPAQLPFGKFRRLLYIATMGGAAVLLLGACSEPGKTPGTQNIHSRADDPMHAELIEVPASLGVLGYRPAAFIAWLDDERLVLADRDAGKLIYVNMRSGTEERFGRRGMGPGEMTLPFSILSRTGDGVLVADGMLTRVTHFNKDGQAAETALFPGRPLTLLGWDRNHVTAAWIDAETSQPVIGDMDLAGGKSRVRFRPYAASEKVAASAKNPMGPSQFVAATMDKEGRVLLGGGNTYEVFRFDSAGKIEAIFARQDLPPERMTDEEFAEFSERLTRVLSTGGEQAMAQRNGILAQYREKPKPFFRMGALSVDQKGRLWVVTTRTRDDTTDVDVFSPDGEFLSTLKLRGTVVVVAPRLPYVAALRQQVGENGEEGVDLYRIVEATGG